MEYCGCVKTCSGESHVVPLLSPGYNYGNVLKKRKFAGLVLTDCFYPPELKTPNHAHEHALFSIALRGTFTVFYKTDHQVYGPSVLVFCPPGEAHRNVFHDSGTRIFNLEIDPHWLEQVLGCSSALRRPFDCEGILTNLTIKLYNELHKTDEVSRLAIEGLTLEMLAEAVRSIRPTRGKTPHWLAQAREIIHEHYSESLTVAAIARSVGIHPIHLARAFRRHYHCTIGDYVRKLRIEYACQQLATTDAPLVEIALAAGFCAQSHFSTAFKSQTGLTPNNYRAAFRSR